jgi:indole-3-glycerol phosphate synthase
VQRLHAAGVDALLVGETLMRAADPVAVVRQWMDACR